MGGDYRWPLRIKNRRPAVPGVSWRLLRSSRCSGPIAIWPQVANREDYAAARISSPGCALRTHSPPEKNDVRRTTHHHTQSGVATFSGSRTRAGHVLQPSLSFGQGLDGYSRDHWLNPSQWRKFGSLCHFGHCATSLACLGRMNQKGGAIRPLITGDGPITTLFLYRGKYHLNSVRTCQGSPTQTAAPSIGDLEARRSSPRGSSTLCLEMLQRDVPSSCRCAPPFVTIRRVPLRGRPDQLFGWDFLVALSGEMRI